MSIMHTPIENRAPQAIYQPAPAWYQTEITNTEVISDESETQLAQATLLSQLHINIHKIPDHEQDEYRTMFMKKYEQKVAVLLQSHTLNGSHDMAQADELFQLFQYLYESDQPQGSPSTIYRENFDRPYNLFITRSMEGYDIWDKEFNLRTPIGPKAARTKEVAVNDVQWFLMYDLTRDYLKAMRNRDLTEDEFKQEMLKHIDLIKTGVKPESIPWIFEEIKHPLIEISPSAAYDENPFPIERYGMRRHSS